MKNTYLKYLISLLLINQKLIDTRKWAPGQYVYTLKAASYTQSGKLIIVTH